jgi:predicted RNase H-like HicB family nuclease
MMPVSKPHPDPAASYADAEIEPRPGVRLRAEIDREDDGRWIADVPELPGVMAYGATRREALAKCTRIAADVLADRESHGENVA